VAPVSTPASVVYAPLGVAISVGSGLLAGVIFSQVWKRVAGHEDAPQARDRTRGWGEVVAAAAVQGAIFAAVKAIVDRGGATGFRRVTGAWPGKE
jgi:Protein of unknown function (DUF4235)